jgi:hypothetical protein
MAILRAREAKYDRLIASATKFRAFMDQHDGFNGQAWLRQAYNMRALRDMTAAAYQNVSQSAREVGRAGRFSRSSGCNGHAIPCSPSCLQMTRGCGASCHDPTAQQRQPSWTTCSARPRQPAGGFEQHALCSSLRSSSDSLSEEYVLTYSMPTSFGPDEEA